MRQRQYEKNIELMRKNLSEEFQEYRRTFEKKFLEDRENFARERARWESANTLLLLITKLRRKTHTHVNCS